MHYIHLIIPRNNYALTLVIIRETREAYKKSKRSNVVLYNKIPLKLHLEPPTLRNYNVNKLYKGYTKRKLTSIQVYSLFS
jgi:hypothetical protein